MNEDENNARSLLEKVVSAAPFDQVAIVRHLAEGLRPWPTDLVIKGEDEVSIRLATLLSSVLADPPNGKLDPLEAGELASLLLPVAVLDESLVFPIREAADRHESDESMNAIEILTYGAAISFVILVATTEFEWKAGKCVRITKRSIGDKTILKLIELLDRIMDP